MRKSHLLALAAASVLAIALAGLHADAQAPSGAALRPGPAPSRPVVALVDVSYIFKNHHRFKASMNAMKAEVERAEAEVKKDREAILRLNEQLQGFRKGTPDYNAIDEDLTRRRTELGVRIQKQKKEFLQREATIYYNVYQEILREVDSYCAANGITMVLRFSGEAADVENPESVLAYINKPVVWYQKNTDITPYILDRLNRDHLNPGLRTGNTAPRPGVPFNR